MNPDFKFKLQEERETPIIKLVPKHATVHHLQVKAPYLIPYIETYIKWRQVGKHAYNNYKSTLIRFLESCYQPLNWNMVQDYINGLHISNNEATAFKYSTIIKKFLEFLDHNTEYTNDAYKKIFIKKFKYEGGNKDIIPDDKFSEMFKMFNFNKVADIRDYAVLKLLQSTGMRLSEPFNIKIGDIKTIYDKNNQPHVIIDSFQKGGHRLVCKLHKGTLDAINFYLDIRGKCDKDDYLFIPHKLFFDGKKRPLDKTVFHKRLKFLFDSVGLYGYTSHSIRYTAAYKTFNQTNDETKASAKLGHLSPKTIQYYTHNFRLELNAINDTNIEIN